MTIVQINKCNFDVSKLTQLMALLCCRITLVGTMDMKNMYQGL